MSDRQRVAQKRPRAGLDLSKFPAQISTSRIVFRAKQRSLEAWWYSSDLSGRFDLPPPNGTSYWADDTATATRERLGERTADTNSVTHATANAFEVARARLPRNRHFAMVSTPEAARFGVTRELVTMVDYAIPQAWAAALQQEGFDGIRYASRFTTRAPTAWAIFGAAGIDKTRNETTPISGPDACIAAGIDIIPSPGRASMYTVVKPPTAN